MSQDFVQKRLITTIPSPQGSGHANLNSTGVVLRFVPPTPVQVTHWGFVSDSAFTTAAALQLAINREATPGGTNTQLDTLTVGNAVAVASGQGFARDANIPAAQTTGVDGSLDNTGDTLLVANPGQALTVSVATAAGATATGFIWIEYVERGFIDKIGADVTGTPAQQVLYTIKAS